MQALRAPPLCAAEGYAVDVRVVVATALATLHDLPPLMSGTRDDLRVLGFNTVERGTILVRF